MKIVNRETFLRLPEGTIFAKGKPWYFEDLCIKGESLFFGSGGSDFIYLALQNIESHDTGQLMDRMDEMLETGRSYPMNDAYGRDGCFDNGDVFMVFEPDDLRTLRGYIDAAIESESTGSSHGD